MTDYLKIKGCLTLNQDYWLSLTYSYSKDNQSQCHSSKSNSILIRMLFNKYIWILYINPWFRQCQFSLPNLIATARVANTWWRRLKIDLLSTLVQIESSFMSFKKGSSNFSFNQWKVRIGSKWPIKDQEKVRSFLPQRDCLQDPPRRT